MGYLDLVVFVGFIAAVIFIGLWKSKDEDTGGEKGASEYFLAGRGLTWWLVGFSLIAANISTEQFVGMSGKAADWLGMAIASYEWMAAVTLVVVAFVFLPKFLKSGIYTIPEFLEYRYNAFARTVMAIFSLVVLVGVPTVTVIFSGAKVITANFRGYAIAGYDLGDITLGCWIIGTLGAVYVFVGGLKACAWADLIQGAALVLGGCIIALFAFQTLGAADPAELIETSKNPDLTVEQLAEAGPWDRFWSLNDAPIPPDGEGKLHMKRPLDDPDIPWSALLIGLWIPNFFYWGLNQYITQRTLGSKSLSEGQKGVVFAAFLKLVIPFVVVIPGILAFNLFNTELRDDAVNRNAEIIAKNSPNLYDQLSEAMKPKADAEENAALLEKIAGFLDSEPVEQTMLYKFDEDFAELYPADAAIVMSYNRAAVGEEVQPEAGVSSVAELAVASSKLTDAASENAETEGAFVVESLVDHDYDNAFPTLIRELLPLNTGIKGFVLAAMFGAVVSSLASMLNSASTIATMDLVRKVAPATSQKGLVTAGRFFIVLFVVVAMYLAPMLDSPEFGGIFSYVQEFQGFLSPGVLAIFIFGLLVHRAPRSCGTVGLLLSPLLFGIFKFGADIPVLASIPGLITTDAMEAAGWAGVTDWSFLDRMALTFGLVLVVLGLMTFLKPLPEPVVLPVNEEMDITNSKGALMGGCVVIALTAILYYIFW